MRALYFCPVVSFFFFSSSNLSGLAYFYTWCGLSANLECRSEMCCTRLAENTERKNDTKNFHLRSIRHLSGWIFTTTACIDNRKQLVKQQYLIHMSPQYGKLRPTSGWDSFGSLQHPSRFQQVSRLGIVTAWHSCSWHQPNFAALNRGHRLYSAGRPSCWALVRILVRNFFSSIS